MTDIKTVYDSGYLAGTVWVEGISKTELPDVTMVERRQVVDELYLSFREAMPWWKQCEQDGLTVDHASEQGESEWLDGLTDGFNESLKKLTALPTHKMTVEVPLDLAERVNSSAGVGRGALKQFVIRALEHELERIGPGPQP